MTLPLVVTVVVIARDPGDPLLFMYLLVPVALAGIMGGLDSEVKQDTDRILLESANFDPIRIRRTSVRLGLRSESSLRFALRARLARPAPRENSHPTPGDTQ